MERIIGAIDQVIRIMSAVTGLRPEGPLWTAIERLLVGIAMIAILALAGFIAFGLLTR